MHPISFFDLGFLLFVIGMRQKKRNEMQLWQLALAKSRARGVPVEGGLEGPVAISGANSSQRNWSYPQLWLSLLIV
jgi:hypothetical protein